MGKRFFTALLALLLIGVQAFAQSAVSGKVTDESGEPCVGTNVLIKGTTTGTMTDLDGNYKSDRCQKGSYPRFLKHWLHISGSTAQIVFCGQCGSQERC